MVTYSDTMTTYITIDYDLLESRENRAEILKDGKAYRRLTPLFFAWLRHQHDTVKNIYANKNLRGQSKIKEEVWDFIHRQFMQIYKYAVTLWGVKNLKSEKFFAESIKAHFLNNDVNDITNFDSFPDYNAHPGFENEIVNQNVFPLNGVITEDPGFINQSVTNYLLIVRKYFPEYGTHSNFMLLHLSLKLLLQYCANDSNNPFSTDYRKFLTGVILVKINELIIKEYEKQSSGGAK